MTDVLQETLSGGTQPLDDIEELRERPSTFLYCEETDEWVLRSRRFDWPHDLYQSPSDAEDDRDDFTTDPADDEDEEPEKIGSWFDVTISVSVDYRFRIPAYSKHEAENIAEERRFDTRPSDSFVVHTTTDERGTITTEDVPEDFDPYGGERLSQVIDADA